jgi:recombination associated protein RdgC
VFKNLMVYNIAPGWAPTQAAMQAGLERARFHECAPSQDKSIGWVEPRGEAHGPLVEVVAGQLILKLMMESKAVPGSVVNRKADAQVAQIEATSGRKPGKKEVRDIKDDIRLALLPQAFTKQTSVNVWIDPKAQRLMLDAASSAKADEVITQLVKSLDDFAVTLVDTKTSPAVAMAQWLTTQDAPAGFSIDRECELKSADETKAVVRYTRHPLDIDEVRQHIEGGKIPSRVGLTWDSRVSFVLTEALQIKKIGFLDVVFENAAGQSRGKDDGFDADVAIATAELAKLLPDLLAALDGEVKVPV